jgi:hypothetical protein
MIHITLKPAFMTDPAVDALGRSMAGYSELMSEEQVHEANRGCWVLGARADREQYVLFSFDGIVRQAMEIDRIVPAGGRRAFEGPVLGPGHPVYDAYVGKPSPIRTRNPVAYIDSVLGRRCRCGCGSEVAKGYFLPGHDQKAIHDRVAKVGSVRDFLAWFDEQWSGEP